MTLRSVGLVLHASDVPSLAAAPVDALVYAHGVPMEADDADGPARYALAELASDLTVIGLSRELSPVIVEFCDRTIPASHPEIEACRNELYTYHLKDQYLVLRCIEEMVVRYGVHEIHVATKPYSRYWSPERPLTKALHRPERALAWMIREAGQAMGVSVVCPSAGFLDGVGLSVSAWLRRQAFFAFKAKRLIQKVRFALRQPRVTLPTGCALAVVRGTSEVATLAPVVDAMHLAGGPLVGVFQDEILHATGAASALDANGWAYVSAGSNRGWQGLRSALLARRQRFQAVQPTYPEAGPAVLKWLCTESTLWSEMARRLTDSWREMNWFRAELEATLKATRPSVIVTCSMVDQWGPCITSVGRALGIPTVAIQNALNNPETYPVMGWADRYCVPSSYQRRRLIEAGLPPDRVVATGVPHLTAPRNLEPEPAPEGPATVLVTTQPITHHENIALCRAAIAACAEASARLILKLHPREDATLYDGMINEARSAGVDVRLMHKEPIQDALSESHLMVSRYSTTIVTALVLGVPTLAYVSPEVAQWEIDFLTTPATETFSGFPALQERLSAWIGGYADFRVEYLAKRDDFLKERMTTDYELAAADAIVSVIREVAASQR